MSYYARMRRPEYQSLIDAALAEDLGEAGDVTSTALFDEETLEARLVSKDTGLLAGAEVFAAVFDTVDPKTSVVIHVADGASLSPGMVVAELRGRAVSVLRAERTALNFLSFLSGIATAAQRFATEAAAAGSACILDTRKTLPGCRALSKYAVRVGGARNHRMGLYDMVLLKDNHIARAGSITAAVARVRSRWGGRFRIEVECRTLEEVREARGQHVEMIMLDNMPLEEIREAVRLCGGSPLLEASGNMDLKRVREVSAAGVDFISVGSLTHSVQAFDFSLLTGTAGDE